MLFLNSTDINNLITMNEAIESIENAFTNVDSEDCKMLPRQIFNIPKQNGDILFMSAQLMENNPVITKIVGSFPNNPSKYKKPTILASLLITDQNTGEIIAFMDGSHLTALRTGAISGVATKYLANKNTHIVGIIGAGIQSETQLLAVTSILNIKKIFIYDINPIHSQNFINKMNKKLKIEFVITNNAKELVQNSELIITATTSSTPVFNGEWLSPGTHINSVGWVGTQGGELDLKTFMRSKLIVDIKESCLTEAGDLISAIKTDKLNSNVVYAELNELINNKKIGRQSNDEITLWKSVGTSIQDAAIAKLAYDKALDKGLGLDIKID